MEENIPEVGYREGVSVDLSLQPESDDLKKEVEKVTASGNQSLLSSSTQNQFPVKDVVVSATGTGDAPKRRKSESVVVHESPASHSNLSSAPSNIPTKQKGVKARDIRIQRKKDKLIARGIDPATVFLPRKPQVAKTVEELTTNLPEAKVKYEVKLLKTDTVEFSDSIPVEHKLYRKYQMSIHGDTESECTLSQYKRFLCDNPLNVSNPVEGDIR